MDYTDVAWCIEEGLSRDGLKYDGVTGRDTPTYEFVFGGGDFTYDRVTILLTVDSDSKSIHVWALPLCHVDEDRWDAMRVVMNASNTRFRWAKFYLDGDGDVMVDADAIITPETAGAVCSELVRRVASVIDDAYADIMKVRWG